MGRPEPHKSITGNHFEREVNMLRLIGVAMLCSALMAAELKVRISWGHESPAAAPYYIRLAPGSGLKIQDASGYQLEADEGWKGDAWRTTAGAGDVDGVSLTLDYLESPETRLQNLH